MLFAFNGTNGAHPQDGLTLGKDGNFYGTTPAGLSGSNSLGNVFRVTPAGALTIVSTFQNTNGANPVGGVVQGSDGTLYGTTAFGGTNLSFGTVFKTTTNGAVTTLFNFHFTDGEEPFSKMIFGPDGNLYGTTPFGGTMANDPLGTGSGTVFRVTTNGDLTSLVVFQSTNGSGPQAPLTLGPDGNLYGTTMNGGTGGGGTIFRIVITPRLTGLKKNPDGSALLTGTGPAGNPFRLRSAADLSAPLASWTVLTNGAFGSDGTFSFPDTGAANAKVRFYRLSTP